MRRIFTLLLPVILIATGGRFVLDYLTDADKEQRENLEALIAQGEETSATLDEEYTIKTTKVAKIPVKTYEVQYTFELDGKTFSGSESLNNPPTSPIIDIKYLPSNPNINAVNPENDLKTLQGKGSIWGLLLGLGIFLGGGALGFYRFKSIFLNRKS